LQNFPYGSLSFPMRWESRTDILKCFRVYAPFLQLNAPEERNAKKIDPILTDNSIVPRKSPNKVRQRATEGMEERGLAEGNLLGQNTFRTQCRGDVPSPPERVRETEK